MVLGILLILTSLFTKSETLQNHRRVIVLTGIAIFFANLIAILILRKEENYTPAPVPKGESPPLTLSFSGGGFRALSAETGVMHGLITYFKKKKKISNAPSFLNKHEIISGNSGGSWFMSLIAYSKNYITVLDNDIPDSTFEYIDECKGNTPYPDSNTWWRWCGTYDSDFHKCEDDYCCCDEDHKQIVPAKKGTFNTTYCQDCDPQTDIIVPTDFNLKNYFYNVIETAAKEEDKSGHTKLVAIINMLPGIEDNIFKPLLYYLTSPWQEVVKNSVFAAADAHTIKAGQNPNNLKTHLVWAGVIMRDSLVKVTDPDNTTTVAATQDPNCGSVSTKSDFITSLTSCGIAYPVIFDYDFTSNKSSLPFCPGKAVQNISYYVKDETKASVTKDVSSVMSTPFPTSETLVYKLASTSGAAAAVLSNYTEINSIVDNYLGTGTISKIFGNLADTGVLTTTKYLANSAIPLQIKNNTPSYFDDGTVPDNINVKTTPVTRLGDGAYFDNSSLAFAIRAWQAKKKTGTVRAMFIDGPTLDDTTNGSTLSASSSRLFGCTPDGQKSSGKTYNYIDSLGSKDLDYEVLTPKIFNSDDFKQAKNIFWSTIKSPTTHLKITSFPTLTTVDNTEIGIKAGTKVELVIFTASSDAPIFTIPTSNTVSDASNYIDTIAAFSKLTQSVPEDILDRLHAAADTDGFMSGIKSVSSATTIS